jgi:hypothetical protein
MKVFFGLLGFAFVMCAAASESPLLLYKTDGIPQKYVLSRSYQGADKINVSETILAETLSAKINGPTCTLTMSNAWVFWTKYSDVPAPLASNAIEQNRIFVRLLNKDFQSETKVIYNSSALPLSQLKLDKNGDTKAAPDQGREVRGKEIYDAVRDYMSKNAIEDSLLRAQMQEIKLEKMHVSSDGVIWFGQDWRYEVQSNRLFNKGVKIGSEITSFVINFQPVNGHMIVRDAKTVRYYGTERKR